LNRVIFKFHCTSSGKEQIFFVDFETEEQADLAIAEVAKAIQESGMKGLIGLLDVTNDRIVRIETKVG
jgi:hypothetical protein